MSPFLMAAARGAPERGGLERDPAGAPAMRDSGIEGVLRDVVETLAVLDRTPCSPGESEAADWLAARLGRVACVDVALEREPSWGTFAPTATALGVLGVAAAALASRGRRAPAALAAALSAAGIADEAQNGPRLLRRAVRRRRETVNVVARVGEPAPRTLVVLAHHDAPQTGFVFDQSLQRKLYERFPEWVDSVRTSPPQWWLGLVAPVAALATAATRRRGPARAGLAVGAFAAVAAADVWRSDTVPGANDNLSGVACLLALAQMLHERPLAGLRVLLVSCGAEETLQDGVRAFLARHRPELEPGRTAFVNLDTVGSPHLAMIEAEGPIWMEDYAGPWLCEQLAACARRLQVPLRRGYRARASTDSVIPSRAGYPIATLVSTTDWGPPANYHLPSDVPANLDYGTVADAVAVTYELARSLAQA